MEEKEGIRPHSCQVQNRSSVRLTGIRDENQEGFRYYEYVGDMTEERFDEFMNQLRQHSFYNTESWPEYGDQLIILSTCSYYTENGRFVVVARRVE